MIQRWSGTIQSFDGTTVWARLRDLTDPSYPDEFAEIRLEKMYGYQRHLRRHIKPGARFTWTIRIKHIKRGVKGRKEVATSEFYFPYVGRWKWWEIHKAHRIGKRFDCLFHPQGSTPARQSSENHD